MIYKNNLNFRDVSLLDEKEYVKYTNATLISYPKFLMSSTWIANHWDKLALYFPSYQQILFNENNTMIGFINAVPIHLDMPLDDLPDEGWDWLFMKSISDFESSKTPNCMGGIQINVLPEYRGKGYSKILLQHAKSIMKNKGFNLYILPIRPNMKWKFPLESMQEYISKTKDDKIYDPWIRTHQQSGAKMLHVCKKSMHVSGNLTFWKIHVGHDIKKSEPLVIPGALNPITVNLQNNSAEYNEENIWIYYN